MPSPVPEQGPVPRPRSRPKTPLPIAAPQSALSEMTDIERNMLRAVEDIHLYARKLGMPPQALTLADRNGARSQIDPEAVNLVERVDRFLADMEYGSTGPLPFRLSEVAAPVDPDAFLVRGFIRPGTTVMLTGPPGSSKSWAARQLALAAGAGLHTYLDRYEVSRPLNVLVIDEDNGPDEEWRREESLLAHLELTRDNVSRVQRTSLAGVQLDNPTWQHWLRGRIQLDELDLVVLDPISEMHGGKELREDPQFRGLLGFLKRLKVDFPRLATLLVHHTRKAPASERSAPRSVDDVRGQWGQTPDVVALMWRLPERRVSWELHKRVPHSKLILEATESGPLQVVSDETTQRSRAMVNDDKVIDALRGGLTTFAELVDGTGLAKGTLSGVLKRLTQAGVIERDGQTYTIDDEE